MGILRVVVAPNTAAYGDFMSSRRLGRSGWLFGEINRLRERYYRTNSPNPSSQRGLALFGPGGLLEGGETGRLRDAECASPNFTAPSTRPYGLAEIGLVFRTSRHAIAKYLERRSV